MKAGAIILAAGASRRMGSPKALLTYEGETFLDRLIGNFEPVCSKIVVVLGHDSDRIRASVTRNATFVFNPDHAARGQLTSLQCGLRAVAPDMDALFFTPVDYPAVNACTITKVAEAWNGKCLAVVPRFEGSHGHPVLVSASLIPRFLDASLVSARDVMHSVLDATRYVDVNDPGILRDVDDPLAYSQLEHSK